MIIKSYTYLLHHKPTHTFYYGVRWAKKCHPDEFWKKYFTSSKKVKSLIKEYGADSFEYEIRKTFDTKEKARDWESKVLQKMKVLENPNLWLNRNDSKAILNEVHPLLNVKMSDITKERIRKSKEGKIPVTNGIEEKFVYSNEIPFGWSIGHSDSWKKKVSVVNSGKNNPMFGVHYRWFQNGIKSIKIWENEPIPKGFIPGRIMDGSKIRAGISNGKF